MKKLLILITALVITSSVHAGQRDFNKVDENQDSQLSLAEFLVHIKADKVDRMTGIFNNRDKNKDGFLTKEEYTVKTKKA